MTTPFKDKVVELNRNGMRFSDMQANCMEARSSAWWNQVANGRTVSPPPRELFVWFSMMMKVPARRIAEMAAEEWYGVRPDDKIPYRVAHLTSSLDELTDADLVLVEGLINRLRKSELPTPDAAEAIGPA